MKKIIFSILLCGAFTSAFSQQVRYTNVMFGAPVILDYVISKSGKNLKYDEIIGTPYLNKNFNTAKVAEGYEEVPVRYNSYSDEIQFQKNNEILALPKEAKFSRVTITSPKQVFVLLNTSDELNGYFVELVSGKTSLYKKIKTLFIDAVPAPNSYASDKPASFKSQQPVYYIQTEKGDFIKKPRNQKDIIELFPDKKDSLNDFCKSNKIKFDKDEDLIKLVNFMNQN